MRPTQNQWLTTDSAQGVLFFAQLIREMLQDGTHESFRVRSLDTITRLDESLQVIRDIERGRIPEAAFESVQEELAWSLKYDETLEKHFGDLQSILKECIDTKRPSLIDAKNKIRYLRDRISGQYKSLIEESILECFSDSSQRAKLRDLANMYLAYVLNKGYSRELTLTFVEDSFFSKDLKRAGKRSISKFFSRFSGVENNYRVFVSVGNDFSNHLKSLGFKIYPAINQLPAKFRASIVGRFTLTPKHSILVREQEAVDEAVAAARCDQLLQAIKAMAVLVPDHPPFEWELEMYVVRFRAQHGELCRPERLPLHRVTVSTSSKRRIRRSLKSYTTKLLVHFDHKSATRIINSLGTCDLAHSSHSRENQLVSLWSAIEVLLTEPKQNQARIVHYVDLLIPLICLRYVRMQMIAIYDELLYSYKSKFKRIVLSEVVLEPNADPHSRFGAILLLDGNELPRQKLLDLCCENPLARHRMSKFRIDFSSPSAMKKTLNSHKERVKWQIHRIYRARNAAVHSGKYPEYLDSLVMNLDEYYRASIGSLVNRATREKAETDIDRLVSEIGVEFEVYTLHLTKLKNERNLSKNSFDKLVR